MWEGYIEEEAAELPMDLNSKLVSLYCLT